MKESNIAPIQKTPSPLLARRMYCGGENKFTPYVSDDDSARVLFFMNLSGAYGGYAGQDQAEADAKLFAAAPDLSSALSKAERFIAGFEDDSTQEGIAELLVEIRAALAKTSGQPHAVLQS